MGAFNTVTAHAACPACGTTVVVRAQFKYGTRWQYEYLMGDTLLWNGHHGDVPGRRSVVVDAFGSARCPKCDANKEWDMYLFVERDRLIRLQTADGTHDFLREHSDHIVLEP